MPLPLRSEVKLLPLGSTADSCSSQWQGPPRGSAVPPTVPLSPSHALQLCERCQQEILDLNDCTTPTWVRWMGGLGACVPAQLTDCS